MKIRSMASLLVLLGLLLNCVGVRAQQQPGGNGIVISKTLTFNKEKFAAKINENKLGGGILDGYAAVIIKDGKYVTEVAGGMAIRGDGANLKDALMTAATPNDNGSAFKLVSFITLLSLFEKRAAQNPANTIEKQLDQPILPYLPRGWRIYINNAATKNTAQDVAVARIAKVTFRQLMSHKSGFRSVAGPVDGTAKSPFLYIKTGIQQKDIGVRSYSNFNGTVITYLLPGLVYAGMADKLDNQLQDDKIANDNHPVYGKLYGDFFENWMQKNVFDVIQSSFRPSCDPAVDFPKRNPEVTFARYYKTPLGAINPLYWSEKDQNHGCHAQGGYYLSALQLAAFMANYQASNILVSEKVRKMMYDDSTTATQDARLGWNKTLSSPFATKYFGVNRIPYHGGSGYGFTAIVQLPGGYIAVGTMNGVGTSDTVAGSLKDAWGAALQDNFE